MSSLNLGSFTTSSPVGESKVNKRDLLEPSFLFNLYAGCKGQIGHIVVVTSAADVSLIMGHLGL